MELRLADGPEPSLWRPSSDGVEQAHRRDLARRRNHKLRVLHGQADIEAVDMDSAKAEYIEREEKRRAAREIREALREMHAELDED